MSPIVWENKTLQAHIVIKEIEVHILYNKIGVVDLDTMLVQAARVCQQDFIQVTDVETGLTREFKNVTELYGNWRTKDGGWLKGFNENNKRLGKPEKSHTQFEIINGCRLKSGIDTASMILDKMLERVYAHHWCSSYRLVMAGEGNYRYKAAVSQPYKAGRAAKPELLADLKQYTLDRYKKDVVQEDGVESDDVVSIMGWWGYNKSPSDPATVLFHIDKDINQVPSYHTPLDGHGFDPVYIDEAEATATYLKQLLVGDKVDNICGLPNWPQQIKEAYRFKHNGVGEKSADAYISSFLPDRCEAIKAVIRAYKLCYGDEKVSLHRPYDGKIIEVGWYDFLEESFQLTRLMDVKGEKPLFINYSLNNGVDPFGDISLEGEVGEDISLD